ncbi:MULTISPECIES: hypothetical protein [Microbacterium]|uniref:hypothetical protein n=1 Tax=Microbacterium TaxID=33882 RepID=UPI000F5DF29D|nr:MULTISPECIES: hypothetical protein [Microbacterium]AZH79157.1 hypothetical protein CSX12_12225 [Microbacterium sp. Y-01]MBM7465001.1 hypothetical protein [Microbacterium esteraromaticum]
MPRRAKFATTVAALALAVTALAGCAASTTPQSADSTPTVSPTPTPDYLTELPQWAANTTPWIIYPDGFECYGTEGCPNDYRWHFGEPGPVLPEGVVFYDPAVHDCVEVRPLGMECGKTPAG